MSPAQAASEVASVSGLGEPVELAAAVYAAVEKIHWDSLPPEIPREAATLYTIAAFAIDSQLLPARRMDLAEVDISIWVVDDATFVDDLQHAIGRALGGTMATNLATLLSRTGQPRSFGRRLRSAWEHLGRFPWVCRWLRRAGALTDDRLLRLLIRQGLDPYQRRPEIKSLAALLRSKGTGSLLEIGTANAGTFAFLANVVHPGAVLVTLDLQRPVNADLAVSFAPARSRVSVETGDSHADATIASVHRRWPDGFDLVFIDGDHTYDGVRKDTLAYADLVKPGGLMAFHDIVPSYANRFGVRTLAEVGGVPEWWRQLKTVLPPAFATHEFVADWRQDGMGIGVVEFPQGPSNIVRILDAIDLGPVGP